MKVSKREIIEKFITAYNSFDISSMPNLLHPDIKFRNISNGQINVHTSGKEAFEKLARESMKLFKKREQKIISSYEVEDAVNVVIHFNGILSSDLPNGLQEGSIIDLQGSSEYIFKDDMIVSITDES